MMDVTLNFEGVRGRWCVQGAFLPPAGIHSCILPSLNSLEFHVYFYFFFQFLFAVLIRFKGQSLTCDQESGLKLIRLQLFALIKDK